MIEVGALVFGAVIGSVHKFDYGHKFAGAASASIVARGAKAGDCRGIAGAGIIGIGGGSALRREREPGFCVAQALPRRSRRGSSCATGAGDGNAGSGARARAGVDSELIEIELAGGCRVRVGNRVKASALRLVLDVLERR